MVVEVGRNRTYRFLWKFTHLKRNDEGLSLEIVRWTLFPHHSALVASSSHTGICRTVGTADLHDIYLGYACQLDVHNSNNFPSLAPSTALNKSKTSSTLRSLIRISPSTILPSSTNRRRATPGRHPTWRDGVTHRSSRQKAMLRMEVSMTRPSAQYSTTSLGVPGSIPTAGIPTRVRARLYASR